MFTYSKFLVSQGCIKPLCDLLNCPNPKIVTVYLEGLENISKVGKADKNLGSIRVVNLYAQMIDDAEGLQKIAILQSRDNTEIYEKDETMPPGDASQAGFQFGGSEIPIPFGGFSFNQRYVVLLVCMQLCPPGGSISFFARMYPFTF